jgi:hypothetical protein
MEHGLHGDLTAKNNNMKQNATSAYESITNDTDDTGVGGGRDDNCSNNWNYIKAEVL